MARVLVADDDPGAVKTVARLLAEEGHEVLAAPTGGELPRDVDVVVLGAGADGSALIERLRVADPHLVVVDRTSDDEHDLLPWLELALERRRLGKRVDELVAQVAQRDRALAASNHLVERTTAELKTTSSSLATATERLVEAEKLAAVGRVVTGIAHELSQQLALVGYAEAIKSRVAHDPELVELADVIVRAQKRLAGMVDEVRDFADTGAARRGLPREPADLAAVVEEALGIIEYDRDVKRRKIVRAWRARPLCALDQGKFQQVVMNLISNAALATRPGDEVRVAIELRGHDAVLTIADDGVGMPPEVVARLGEPFFTTRGDRGSGLGVGICKRIIEEHGGHLEYASEVGRGTTARVTLPSLESGPA